MLSKRYLVLKFSVMCVLLLANLGYAASNQVERHEDGTISVTGFGTKRAALLYDKAEVAFENGIENNFSDRYVDGANILRSTDTQSIWKSVSAEDGVTTVFMDRKAEDQRHSGSRATYFGNNRSSFLDNPRVWSKNGTPTEAKKLYVSWWFKQENDTRWYRQVQISTPSNGYVPQKGDTFTIAVGPHWSGVTSVSGRVIAYIASEHRLHAEFFEQNNLNLVMGKTIEFTRGATALLESQLETTGANKYIRVWETPHGEAGTFRLSWVQTAVYVGDMMGYVRADVGNNKWCHFEIYINQIDKTVKIKLNSEVQYSGTYTEDLDVDGYSPTIGLIGMNASVDIFQNTWLDEIYMDNEFKHVVLSNAPNASSIDHEEIQNFVSWDSSGVRFKPEFGSLDTRRNIYLYVYGEDGAIANTNGVLISRPNQPNPR